MASKKVHLNAPPIGGMAILTLPVRDDAGVQSLIEATREFGLVRATPHLTPLDLLVNLYTIEGMSPHEENLRHFVRMVEHHLNATCTFGSVGQELTQEEWVAAVMKPINEQRGR